jgi:hypothetical protein
MPDLPAGIHVTPEGTDLRLLGIAQVRQPEKVLNAAQQ